jgi:hypothetical protein
VKDITEAVRDVLRQLREIDEWREEHDPGTPEWLALCGLADAAGDLVYRLPTEMLPEEDFRLSDEEE